jgi:hypothetical protein
MVVVNLRAMISCAGTFREACDVAKALQRSILENFRATATARGRPHTYENNDGQVRVVSHRALIRVSAAGTSTPYNLDARWALATFLEDWNAMNRIIYIVGLVVIVLVILGFFGLR